MFNDYEHMAWAEYQRLMQATMLEIPSNQDERSLSKPMTYGSATKAL
jgi:hypothetical protein